MTVRGALTHRVARATCLRLVALVMGVASSVALARWGGPSVKGLTSAFAASSILAFTVVNLDLPQQALRYGRHTHSLGVSRERIVKQWPKYVLAALTIAVGFAAFSRIDFAWIAIGTLTYLASAQLGVLANGLSGPTVTAFGGILQQGGMVLGALVLWRTGHLTLQWAPALVIFSFLCPLPLYAIGSSPKRAPVEPVARRARVTWRLLAKAGLRWQPARLSQLLLLRLDTLVVYWTLGAKSAGIYSVGLATAGLAGIIPAQFASNSTFEATRGDTGSLRRNSISALISGGVGALFLACVGLQMTRVVYGNAFASSYAIMLVTLPGIAAYGVLQVFTNHMRLVGRPGSVSIPSTTGLAVMVAGLVCLVPTWREIGAGLASSAGALTAVAVAYRNFCRRT